MIIGLVGGIASGKSFVARKLASLKHGLLIEADAIAKAKLADNAVVLKLKDKFGDSVFTQDGIVNRAAIAKLVFGDTVEHDENRRWLNDLIHPLVRATIQRQITDQQAKSPETWIILDIPLLLESGWNSSCDRIIFVDTPVELRQKYAAKRGWHPTELTKREQNQISLENKRAAATDVLLNTGVESDMVAALTLLIANW